MGWGKWWCLACRIKEKEMGFYATKERIRSMRKGTPLLNCSACLILGMFFSELARKCLLKSFKTACFPGDEPTVMELSYVKLLWFNPTQRFCAP